jgi:hypothetical protein
MILHNGSPVFDRAAGTGLTAYQDPPIRKAWMDTHVLQYTYENPRDTFGEDVGALHRTSETQGRDPVHPLAWRQSTPRWQARI